MDFSIVSPSFINLMLTGKLFPDDQERESLLDWDESQGSLNKVERYFLVLSSIPGLEQRLSCMDTAKVFQSQYDDIDRDLNTLREATKRVKSSKAFKDWLTLILATGNYMNGKTKHGCAFGFDLKTLDKLPGTKSTSKPPVSLMQWLVHFVVHTMKDEEMLKLDKDWHIISAVKTVLLSELDKNLNLLEGKVTMCEAALAEERGAGDKFNEVIKPFVLRSKQQIDLLKKKHSAIVRAFTEMYVSFGMSEKKMDDKSIKELWDRLKEFADNITKVGITSKFFKWSL
jgi:hypothetical protein